MKSLLMKNLKVCGASYKTFKAEQSSHTLLCSILDWEYMSSVRAPHTFKFFIIQTCSYHKLANTWKYTTTNNTLTIVCQGTKNRGTAEQQLLGDTPNKNESHKFVILDFEFSMVNRTSMVVISGAMSNSLDPYKIRKLEGRPLMLPLNEEVRPVGETELQVKTELRDACLDLLKQNLNSTKHNLTKEYIDSYIRRGNKENVIVV
ncbi:hypothetical protein AGLY_015384 [Aphis glycines]|uniref:Uncharacterized protein n=1 Tax=Aphis glycines TaxID=307491 RepID=A0A6G0T1W9_APHGL|nr:hypothetical protein AGLY_015384 [Aphis glycines]